MRKFIALLGVGAMASVIPAAPVLAGGSIVVTGDQCAGFVPTVNGGVGYFLTTTDSHQVVKGNKLTLTCHFDIPAGQEPPRGVKADGVTCVKIIDTHEYPTNNTRMQASPGGRATGTCRWDDLPASALAGVR